MLCLFSCGKSVYIDKDFLIKSYKNGRLLNSNVLAKLFNIYPGKEMNYEMRIENGKYMIFTDLDITFESWSLLITFLKIGHICYNPDTTIFMDKINNVILTSNKLGGIPSYDEYCSIIFNDIEKEYKIKTEQKRKAMSVYNPMTPVLDYENKYDWIIGTVATITEGYSFTVKANETHLYYMRRLST